MSAYTLEILKIYSRLNDTYLDLLWKRLDAIWANDPVMLDRLDTKIDYVKKQLDYLERRKEEYKMLHEIKEVNSEQLKRIIETKEPLGLYYTKENEIYVAVDNSKGNAWTEEFSTKEMAVKYLNGDCPCDMKTYVIDLNSFYVQARNVQEATAKAEEMLKEDISLAYPLSVNID